MNRHRDERRQVALTGIHTSRTALTSNQAAEPSPAHAYTQQEAPLRGLLAYDVQSVKLAAPRNAWQEAHDSCSHGGSFAWASSGRGQMPNTANLNNAVGTCWKLHSNSEGLGKAPIYIGERPCRLTDKRNELSCPERVGSLHDEEYNLERK